MRKTLCLFLCALLLGGLLGCHYSNSGDILEPVEFFYPRKSDQFIYGTENGVFGSEIREASGHRDDLNYLISMYMRGPQDSHLRSPFPAGCRLMDIRYGGDTVCLVLTGEFTTLENMELTLACAALTQTCLGLSDATRVRIDAESETKSFSITLDADSMILSDNSSLLAEATAETP